jgi:hypothetical protein
MTGYCEKTSRCGDFEHPASVLNSDRVAILRYWKTNTEIMIDFVVTVRNEIHILRDDRNIPSDEIVTAIKKDGKNFERMARINRVLQVKKKIFRSTRPVMNDMLKQNNNNNNTEELPFTLCNVGTNRECLCYKNTSVFSDKIENTWPKCNFFIADKNISVLIFSGEMNNYTTEDTIRMGFAKFIRRYCEITSKCDNIDYIRASEIDASRIVLMKLERGVNNILNKISNKTINDIWINFVVALDNGDRFLRREGILPSEKIIEAIAAYPNIFIRTLGNYDIGTFGYELMTSSRFTNNKTPKPLIDNVTIIHDASEENNTLNINNNNNTNTTVMTPLITTTTTTTTTITIISESYTNESDLRTQKRKEIPIENYKNEKSIIISAICIISFLAIILGVILTNCFKK